MNNIIVTLLSALIGGLIGTYAGARFLNTREENKMKKVREIAIKALNIIKNIPDNHLMRLKTSSILH